MPEKDAWLAVQSAHRAGQLSPLHDRLYFRNPRPVLELYDLAEDPHELENLVGKEGMSAIEKALRIELERWMIRESDFLPLPTDVLSHQ